MHEENSKMQQSLNIFVNIALFFFFDRKKSSEKNNSTSCLRILQALVTETALLFIQPYLSRTDADQP